MLLEAERHRIPAHEAERVLAGDEVYSSPFITMPF